MFKKKSNASIDSFPCTYSLIVQLNDRGEIDDFHILRVYLIAQNDFVKVFETISQPQIMFIIIIISSLILLLLHIKIYDVFGSTI